MFIDANRVVAVRQMKANKAHYAEREKVLAGMAQSHEEESKRKLEELEAEVKRKRGELEAEVKRKRGELEVAAEEGRCERQKAIEELENDMRFFTEDVALVLEEWNTVVWPEKLKRRHAEELASLQAKVTMMDEEAKSAAQLRAVYLKRIEQFGGAAAAVAVPAAN